jgi:hypothetical protein
MQTSVILAFIAASISRLVFVIFRLRPVSFGANFFQRAVPKSGITSRSACPGSIRGPRVGKHWRAGPGALAWLG